MAQHSAFRDHAHGQQSTSADRDTGSRIRPWRVVLFGFVVWAVVFAVAMAMYPWRVLNRPLFETMIAVVLAAATTTTMIAYLAPVRANFVRHAAATAVVWPIVSLLVDFVMFGVGPMNISTIEYFQDIGLTYLMIPIITLGLGYERAKPVDR